MQQRIEIYNKNAQGVICKQNLATSKYVQSTQSRNRFTNTLQTQQLNWRRKFATEATYPSQE